MRQAIALVLVVAAALGMAVPLVLALATAAWAYPPLTVEREPFFDMAHPFGGCFTVDVHGMRVESVRVDEWASNEDLGSVGSFTVVAVNNSGVELDTVLIRADVDVYRGGKYIESATAEFLRRPDGSPLEYGQNVVARGERMYILGHIGDTAPFPAGPKPELRVRDVSSSFRGCGDSVRVIH